MANDATKVGAGITGAVAVDKTNTASAPTGTASALTGFTEVGFIGDDGVTEARSRSVEAFDIPCDGVDGCNCTWCYKVSSNGFHMTNQGQCSCWKNECPCVHSVLR